MNSLAAIVAAVVVGTWNGSWFPSGRAEHRAHPDVEAATTAAAAAMIARGLAAADPSGTNDVVLCLNEIRGPRAASNLVARIGRTNLVVVSVSGYRRRDRFDQQQDVVATTLPVAASGWEKFRLAGKNTPPRGYAYADVVVAPAVTAAVYAVHLKSNYGATRPELVVMNRTKRTLAVEQIIARETKLGRSRPVIVAGDMNADRWRKEFSEERIFPLFDAAGFLDLLSLLPPGGRGTHPSKKWGDSALDYVFVRGFVSAETPRIVSSDGLSDHDALFTLVALPDDGEGVR